MKPKKPRSRKAKESLSSAPSPANTGPEILERAPAKTVRKAKPPSRAAKAHAGKDASAPEPAKAVKAKPARKKTPAKAKAPSARKVPKKAAKVAAVKAPASKVAKPISAAKKRVRPMRPRKVQAGGIKPIPTVVAPEPEPPPRPQPVLEAIPSPAPQPEMPAPRKLPAEAERRASTIAAEFNLKIPPILFEGDEPSRAGFEGPGQKFELAPRPLRLAPEPQPSVLPEAYGTGRLFLTARDPHCLYAHWDLTAEQQRRYNNLSLHHHLLVRVYRDSFNTPPLMELHVHPESRHWFIHVDIAAANYIAELGYYERAGAWRLIAASQSATTPPDTISPETRAEFVTIPFDIPLPAAPTPSYPITPQPLLPETRPETRAEVRQEPEPYLPRLEAAPVPPIPTFAETPPARWELPLPTAAPGWTLAQEAALAEVITMSLARREWIGSAEIEELLRKAVAPAPLPGPVSSQEAAALGRPLEQAVFSPGAHQEVEIGEVPIGFWFNVNAELVIYGATEPDARVSIGGRQIRLRPDGTFSYRFALPDGAYELPIDAVAVHGDTRQARLSFYRGTKHSGEVGAHPQDPALKAPLVQNVG